MFGISDEWFAIGDSLILTVLSQVIIFSIYTSYIYIMLSKENNYYSLIMKSTFCICSHFIRPFPNFHKH